MKRNALALAVNIACQIIGMEWRVQQQQQLAEATRSAQ